MTEMSQHCREMLERSGEEKKSSLSFPQMGSPACCPPAEVQILMKALRNKQALLGIVLVQHKIQRGIYALINVLLAKPKPPMLT